MKKKQCKKRKGLSKVEFEHLKLGNYFEADDLVYKITQLCLPNPEFNKIYSSKTLVVMAVSYGGLHKSFKIKDRKGMFNISERSKGKILSLLSLMKLRRIDLFLSSLSGKFKFQG